MFICTVLIAALLTVWALAVYAALPWLINLGVYLLVRAAEIIMGDHRP
jgi:hypothetical protein